MLELVSLLSYEKSCSKNIKYEVKSISTYDDIWRNEDFCNYDIVFHVAGIAHIKSKKITKEIYYKVNYKLTEEIACKAKESGVKQFIFMSSMSVYGISSGMIDKNTTTNPKTYYGWSKLLAEQKLLSLQDNSFNISIVRAPMIYGRGCKGNYKLLSNIASKLPLFPDINNSRSMIYIDNLSSFIKKIIDNNMYGIFFPQNQEYICTSKMVYEIAKNHGKNIRLTKVFNPLLSVLPFGIIDKVFGDLKYEKKDTCNDVSFIQSIIDAERDNVNAK